MRIPVLVGSFRARLLLLLVALLGLTLGVQYYVNLRSVRTTTRLVAEQQHAIMAGVALGLNSLWSEKYLDEIRDTLNDPLLDEHNGQVTNVLVVDNEGNILDSLVDTYNPTKNSDGSTRYVQFSQVPLPSLRSAVRLSDESQSRPPWLTVSGSAKSEDSAAFYFPVETNTGRRFVIVV